VNVREDK
jgi:hypothetical protein